jgi:hypothetical protein
MVKKKKRSVHTTRSALVIHLLTKEEKWELGIVEVVGVLTEMRGPTGFINCEQLRSEKEGTERNWKGVEVVDR